MRTTLPLDDDLLRELRASAQAEGISLAKMANRVLRLGMRTLREGRRSPTPYREKTFPMGVPAVDLTKALALAAALEDAEVREELARHE